MLPYEHSESIDDQIKAVEFSSKIVEKLKSQDNPSEGLLKFAESLASYAV